MKKTTQHRTATFAICILAIAVILTLIEGYGHYNYGRWQQHYAKEGDWYDFLAQPSNNPRLLWEYRANFERRGIRTNQYGFRDLEVATDRTKNIRRIAFFGDSVTLGLSVPFGATFVRQLSKIATTQPNLSPTEFLNFGIDGYHVEQIAESLHTNLNQFQPDKAIYVMCLNDVDLGGSMNEKVRYFSPPTSFILEKIERLLLRYFFVDDFLDYFFFRYGSRFLDAISAMQETALNQGIEFAVVIVPVFNFGPETALYPYTELHKNIGQALTSRQISQFDLLRSFSDTGLPANHWNLDIWHPNTRGHAFIARSIAPFVLTQE